MKLRWGKAASRGKKASSGTAGMEGGRSGGNTTADGFAPEAHEDDVFFDPRPSPGSDGDDDFYSVTGDLTPARISTPSRSCGSTPKHHDHSPRTTAPASNNGYGASAATGPGARANPEEDPAPNSTFGAILKSSKREDAAGAGSLVVPTKNGDGGGLPPKCSADGSNRARTPSGESGHGGGKTAGTGFCCIPRRSMGRSKRRRQQQDAVDNAGAAVN